MVDHGIYALLDTVHGALEMRFLYGHWVGFCCIEYTVICYEYCYGQPAGWFRLGAPLVHLNVAGDAGVTL